MNLEGCFHHLNVATVIAKSTSTGKLGKNLKNANGGFKILNNVCVLIYGTFPVIQSSYIIKEMTFG